MYREFYRYNDRPFSLLNPDHFYLSGTHKKILDTLKQSIDKREFLCVLTGDFGVGKSALTRYLLDNLEGNYTAGLVSSTDLTAINFIPKLLEAYSQPSSGSIEQLTKSFSQFISAERSKNYHSVLIIDDCHKLPVEVLNIIHVIIQEFSIVGKAFTTILVGEPALQDKLSQKDLEHLSQQINTSCELKPLSKDKTTAYIHYQNEVTGAEAGLFEDDACKLIYENTKGIPRSINLLCDSALVYGFLDESKTITKKIVSHVISDKKAGKLLPNLARAEEISKERAQQAARIKAEKEAHIKDEEMAGTGEGGISLKTVKVQEALRNQQEEQETEREQMELARQRAEKENQSEKIDVELETKISAETPATVTDITQTDSEREPQVNSGSILKTAIGLVLVIAVAGAGYVFYPDYSKFISPLITILNSDEVKQKQAEERAAALKAIQEEQKRKAAELAASRAEEQAREAAAIKAKKEKAALKARLERERAVALQAKRKEAARKKKAAQEREKQKILEAAARKKGKKMR